MAQITYDAATAPTIEGARIAILMSKWHLEHSERMSKKCSAILQEAGSLKPDVHILPGCIEIPLAARRIAQTTPAPDAIVVFGVILKGDTHHFDIVMQMCMRGIERVMFETDIPIINEVLPVNSIEDVIARSSDDENNKGIEAALAAAEIIHWRRSNPVK